MNVLKTAQIVLALLPIITDVVKQVEAMSTVPGNGSQKLQLALTLIRTIYDASSPVESFDSIRAKVEGIIAAVVNFYNVIGAFAKAVKAA